MPTTITEKYTETVLLIETRWLDARHTREPDENCPESVVLGGVDDHISSSLSHRGPLFAVAQLFTARLAVSVSWNCACFLLGLLVHNSMVNSSTPSIFLTAAWLNKSSCYAL